MYRKASLPVTAALAAVAAAASVLPSSHAVVPSRQPLPGQPPPGGQPARLAALDSPLGQAERAVSTYLVRSGDTLSEISGRFCGTPADYPALAAASGISDANRIYIGEIIRLACQEAYRALGGRPPGGAQRAPERRQAVVTSFSGHLGCTGLEALWEAAGGAHDEAFTAAEIAEAESGGNQYALSPTNDYGYWQINGSHGPAMATFDAMGNARAAVEISGDGSDWGAWTTYVTGAYRGRC